MLHAWSSSPGPLTPSETALTVKKKPAVKISFVYIQMFFVLSYCLGLQQGSEVALFKLVVFFFFFLSNKTIGESWEEEQRQK